LPAIATSFSQVMPFADGILALAQRLGFTIHFCTVPGISGSTLQLFAKGPSILALDGEGDLPGESVPRSNQHISEIAFRATGVSAVEGW